MAMKQPRNVIPIEGATRLSHSLLWKLQKKAYTEFGPAAWTTKGVPSYVTSNPLVARSYAFVVLGYIRDCLNKAGTTPIDPAHPFYIFDLGAGTGRFGYLFLKNLAQTLQELKIEGVQIRYVMTDIAPANIAFWRAHPYLQPLIQQGMLDFAYYQHDDAHPLKLEVSGEVLSPSSIVNPIALIGNYFFDTIPQDLFKVENGTILEGRIALGVKKNAMTENLSPHDPAVINHLVSSFEYVPIPQIEHYYPDQQELLPILKRYASTLEGIPFVFPAGAFTVIRYFRELSKNRLLLLAGDQGKIDEKQLKVQPDPFLALHGSFSIGVNYHAIAQYFRNMGGATFLTTFPNPSLVVTCSVVGGSREEFPETKVAFEQHIDRFEPNDYYQLINYSEKEWAFPSLDLIFLLLKIGEWDPANFNLFFERIRSELKTASDETKERFSEVVEKVWRNFYPTDKKEALFVMNLGVLLYDLKRHPEAIKFFERALELDSEEPMIYHNMACCYFEMGDQANFRRCQALAVQCPISKADA